MKIEPLDDKTVKILLTRLDMQELALTYEEMDYKNPETRRVILHLMEEIRRRFSIDLSAGKLFIEAFPYADGGCILYLNLVESNRSELPRKHKTSFDTPLIFSFLGLEPLVQLAVRMNQRYGHTILKSVLYLENERYLLLLYTYFKMDEQITRLLSEYGSFYGKGAVAAALCREHGQELIPADALQILSEQLG